MISRDDWLKALDAAGLGVPQNDETAITVSEFMAMTGYKRTRAETALNEMVRRGAAVRTTKLAPRRQDHKMCFLSAYQLKVKPKKKS